MIPNSSMLPAAARSRSGAAALLTALALAAPAHAQEAPLGFTFGPGETVTHDSNVLRVPGYLAGPTGAGDTSSLTDLTGTVHEVYGRDDFTVSATLGRVIYKHLSYLDYTQQDLHGTFHANLPLNIDAAISGVHTASLAHFADFTITKGAPIPRNVITGNNINGYVDAPVFTDFRAIVGGAGSQSRNSADSFKTQDFNTAEVNGGIRYQPSTGNHVDLLARSTTGTYVNGSPAAFVGPGYRTRGADLSADWTFAGASHLHGRAGYVRHSGDDYVFPVTVNGSTSFVDVDRNFSGPAFDLTYLWDLSAAARLKFYGLRETGAAGDNSYQSAVTHTYRITPTYLPTVKTEIDAYAEWSRRDYFTNVLVAIGQSNGIARLDQSHSVGLTALWNPRRWIQLKLDLRHEIRDSTEAAFAYTDTAASLMVQGTF
jgi:hypothetical protein